MVGRGQDNQILATIVLVYANDVEQVHGEADQAGVIILLFNAFSERLGFFTAVGVDLQQAVTTLFWTFGFASLFWALVTPWWGFPFGELDSAGNALLAAGVIVVGTLLPFICMVAALRHIPAPRAAVVATLEPLLAGVFAWLILGEELAAVQLAGGAAVLAAVVWVQLHRPDLEAEVAPPVILAAQPNLSVAIPDCG